MIRSNKILKGGVDTTEFEIERDVLKEYKFPIFEQYIIKLELSLGDFIDEEIVKVEDVRNGQVVFVSLKFIDFELYKNLKVFNKYSDKSYKSIEKLKERMYVSSSQQKLEEEKQIFMRHIEFLMRMKKKIDELISREKEIRGNYGKMREKYITNNRLIDSYPPTRKYQQELLDKRTELDTQISSFNDFFNGLKSSSKNLQGRIQGIYDEMLKLEMRFMKKMLEEKHASEKQAHLDESLASIEATFEKTSSERKDEEETRLAEKARKIAEIEAEREKRRIEGERIAREKKEEEARLERERKEEEARLERERKEAENARLESERKEAEDNKLFEKFSKAKGIHYHELKETKDPELMESTLNMFYRLPEEFEELFGTELFNGIGQSDRLDGPLELNVKNRISLLREDHKSPLLRAQRFANYYKKPGMEKKLKELQNHEDRKAKQRIILVLKRNILEAFLQSFKNREIYEKYEGIKKAETRRKTSEVKRLSNSRVSKSSSNKTRKKETNSGTRRSSTLRRGTAMNSSGSLRPVPSARKK